MVRATEIQATNANLRDMRPLLRWGLLCLALILVLAGVGLLVLPGEILDPVDRLTSPRTAILLGIVVLSLDAVAPVPSSAVMFAMGATLGIGVATAAALVGLTGAALIGYGLGRFGVRRAAGDRFTESDRLELLSSRRGMLAVIVSRPVPLLAETTATLAGVARMPIGAYAIAAATGALAPALVYAALGRGLTTWSAAPTVAVATVSVVIVSLLIRRRMVVPA